MRSSETGLFSAAAKASSFFFTGQAGSTLPFATAGSTSLSM